MPAKPSNALKSSLLPFLLVASVSIPALLIAGTKPALADSTLTGGGNGGDWEGFAGGAGGIGPGEAGGDAPNPAFALGGGGGGAGGGAGGTGGTHFRGAIGGNGGAGGIHGNLVGQVPVGGTTGGGGMSGDGGTAGSLGTGGAGGGGGAGGYGAIVTASENILIGVARGGRGGDGGDGLGTGFGGVGGTGGVAGLFSIAGSLNNMGQFAGGAGGDGGIGYDGGRGGNGGDGINAKIAEGELIINNAGAISGGAGGNGGSGTRNSAAGGAGGAGIYGTNLRINNSSMGNITGGDAGGFAASGDGIAGSNLTIVNAGTIASGAGSFPGAAIRFIGGTNVLEIEAGSTIQGDVLANAASDTFRLAGDSDGAFDVSQIGDMAQYRGFEHFEKTGSNYWTLTGTTSAVTPWQIKSGRLIVSQDEQLGTAAGTLTLDGGSFGIAGATFGTSTRAIVLAGSGAINVSDAGAVATLAGSISGQSQLAKSGLGTLVLSGDNSYEGGTSILGGTLSIASDRNLGASGTALALSDGATLAVTGSFSSARDIGLSEGVGNLDIAAEQTFTLSGIIAGDGGLTKSNAGTLVLTGENRYAGGTTIAGGTLQIGDGGTSGSIRGNIVNNGILAFNRSDFAMFEGDVSGTGSLRKEGEGMLVLTGTNTYGGGTTISGGTLHIGNGGATGSIVGNVVNNGSLVFDSSAAQSMAGDISGSGNLRKEGAGKLTLSGNNTYAGLTNVNTGTLALVGGHAISDSGLVGLGNGATLEVVDSETIGALIGSSDTRLVLATGQTLTTSDNSGSSFAGTIEGAGNFSQNFDGTTTIDGQSTFIGATSVLRGTLVVNGSIAASSGVEVGPNGTLKGNGTLPSTTVHGTISPGNSPGTMVVNGNLTLGAGSLYIAEIQGAASDRIGVTGTAALAGTLRIVPLGGAYAFSTPYTLLSAAGGRNGTFGTVDTTGSFGDGVATSVAYTANDVQLTLTPRPLTPTEPPVTPPAEPPVTPPAEPPATPPTDPVVTPPTEPAAPPAPAPKPIIAITAPANVFAVASAIDRSVAGGANPSALFGIYNLPAAAIPAAVNQLSGEAHTAAPAMAVTAADQFLRAMLDPLAAGRLNDVAGTAPGAAAFSGKIVKGHDLPAGPAQLDQPRYSVWGSAFGSFGRTDGSARIGSAKRDLDDAHLAVGADVRLMPGTVAGFAVSGGASRASLAGGLGKAEAEAFQAGLYGMTRLGPLNLAAAVGYARLETDVTRAITALGTSQSSSYATTAWSGRFQASAAVLSWNGLTVSPLAAVQATRVRSPAITEANWTGANAGALSLGKRSDVTARGELGLQLDMQTVLGTMPVSGYVRAGWAHYFQRDAGLSASLDGLAGASFVIQGARPDRNAALVAAGVDVKIAPNVSLGARLDGEFSGNANRLGGSAQLRVSF